MSNLTVEHDGEFRCLRQNYILIVYMHMWVLYIQMFIDILLIILFRNVRTLLKRIIGRNIPVLAEQG